MSIAEARTADPAVPGLTLAMSREGLLELLQEHLPECRRGMRVLDARVLDVQYSPGDEAQVLWKLHVREPDEPHTMRQLVCVRALRRDDAAREEPKELIARYGVLRGRRGMRHEMPIETPWLFVRPAHVVVQAFPLDPALPTLIDVVDPHTMREALHRAWQPRRVRVRRVRSETLAYTPGTRAALKFEVLSEDKDTGLPEARRLVGKLDARRLPARLFAGHWALWRRTAGRVSIAPPVGYVAVARLSLQEFVSGTRLSDLAGTGAFPGCIRETARSIANVHALRLPVLGTRGLEKELRAVDRWRAVLTGLCPDQRRRLEAIGQRIRAELAARLRIEATVHADFHLANVLADDFGVTLIDWDQIAHGDPMGDVGRVLASLRVSSLRLHGRIDGFSDAGESFLQMYLQSTHGDERRARLFEAIGLLVSAAAPFRLQRPGWEEAAHSMLDEVERTLDLSVAPAGLAAGTQVVERDLTFNERVQWALDGPFVQSLLVALVHERDNADIEVTECSPAVRQQTGRSIHLQWRLKGYRGGERWRSILDGFAFRGDSARGRLRRLETAWAATNERPDALQLPRPLGHLTPLSMIVAAPRGGEALAGLLGTDREADGVRRAATALAAFHGIAIDVGKRRELTRAVRTMQRRVDRICRWGDPGSKLRGLWATLRHGLAESGERSAATISGLTPASLLIDATGVSVAFFEDVLMADPRMSVGELLAILAGEALAAGRIPSAAAQFRRAYANASGCDERELAFFETLSLLLRACRRATGGSDAPAIVKAIEYGASLVKSGLNVPKANT